MDRDYQMLTFAGLFHDIGKFSERAGDYKEQEPKKIEQKYSHAWYSYMFLHAMFNWSEQYDTNGTDIATLASFHHRPENNIYNCILAEADRQAAGHERVEKEKNIIDNKLLDEINARGKENIPLYPITERVARIDNNEFIEKDEVNSFFYLSKLTDVNELYPRSGNEFKNYEVKEAYKNHYKSFKNEFSNFIYYLKQNKEFDFFDNYETFKSILQKYLWCIPQDSQYQSLPDVSLFEHLKLTAMLTGALYLYHKEKDTLNLNEIKSRNIKKYLLVSGDLSGIQNFIYDIESKKAYKTLKGRSFFMQLLPYIISKRILNKLDMNESQILYSTGGHFYLILPNLNKVKKILNEEFEEINFELLKEFDGKLFLRNGYEEFAPDLLENRNKDDYNFCFLWDKVQKKISQSDRKKYAFISKREYKYIFDPGYAEFDYQNIDFSEIGEHLQNNKFVVFIKGERFKNKILGYSFDLYNEIRKSKEKINYLYFEDNNLFNQKDIPFSNSVDITFFPIGGIEGFINKTFEDIAKDAKGSNLIGLLRMDVDNLGKIFSKGLVNYNHRQNYNRKDFEKKDNIKKFNFHSIGRITTLSSQLIMFFSLCLENIVQNEKYSGKVVIVYSGGDDVFLLGEWHLMPDIAIEINNKFNEFVCHNPAFSLSGGITLIHGKYPLYKAAELTGEAEEKSKEFERVINGKNKIKNAISFMGQVFDWNEFEELNDIASKYIDNKELKPLINRINLIAQSHQVAVEERKKLNNKLVSEKEILKLVKSERWQWLMVYSFERMKEQYKNKSEVKKMADKTKNYFLNNVSEKEKIGIENSTVLGKWIRNINREL